MTLSELPRGQAGVIVRIDGEHAFRRRLLEMGLLPGTRVKVLRVAPLGDPIELWCRGGNLSIRHREAERIEVTVSAGTES